MKRINKENINTPDFFNKKFNKSFGLEDMKRLYLLAKYYNGGIYVDVGCMDSIMPALLAETNSNIYALDFAEEIIDYLSIRFPKVKYKTIKTCYELPFENESVDYIVAGELIEHLEEPARFIKEAMRVLKKGGYLAISTPFEELVSQLSVGGKQHLWSFNLEDIKTLLNEPEIDYYKDTNSKSILAWKKK